MQAGSPADAPRWDLSAAYPGFDSPEYARDRNRLTQAVAAFETLAGAEPRDHAAAWIRDAIDLLNEIGDLYENLEVFCYTSYSVDTRNTETLRELNALDELMLPVHGARVQFRNHLAGIVDDPERFTTAHPELAEYRFFLGEELQEQEKQMSAVEENLAADLARSGADAWSRLQETISANLSTEWNGETGERKTVVQLRGLAFNADRRVRKRAYEKELAAWKSMEIPLAAALNGVKGTAVTLDGRRHHESSLERARRSARISRETLDSLILAMREALPDFRRYLKAKARLLGLDRLAFYDLFAPVTAGGSPQREDAGSGHGGAGGESWSFAEARDFIVRQFRSFSEELGAFAERAFAEQWIDAEPRAGKVGGAYCAPLPLARQSRILANFDGSFSSLSTIAHELGHGYHHEVLKEATSIHREYPMTLAETASIFCETIVFTRAYEQAGAEEKLGILEAFLQDATQVIVDILSRFTFESSVFERRPGGELSAENFKELMLEAQKATYGDGLDETQLHPYMWAVKGHYYNQDLSFYNFPYAFGQLFGLGLFSQYQRLGEDFPPQYRRILEMTGRATAEEVTAGAGFDIRQADFWRGGIDYIRSRIDEFVERVDTATAAG